MRIEGHCHETNRLVTDMTNNGLQKYNQPLYSWHTHARFSIIPRILLSFYSWDPQSCLFLIPVLPNSLASCQLASHMADVNNNWSIVQPFYSGLPSVFSDPSFLYNCLVFISVVFSGLIKKKKKNAKT